MIGECDFKCVEGECYGDDIGDCNKPQHQSGISKMILLRKTAHIYHALRSLSEQLLGDVIEDLVKHPEWTSIKDYVPQTFASDYRCYISDLIRVTLQKAHVIVETLSSPSELAPEYVPTYQFARDMTIKATNINLSFDVIDWPTPPPPPQQRRKRYRDTFDKFKTKYVR
jgi:hypothetical protein